MKTDDQLIADFMEFSYCPVGSIISNVEFYNGHDSLKFNKSFDWLAPVIRKINDICKENIIDKDTRFADLDDATCWRAWSYRIIPNIDLDIQITYARIIEFIKWYNSQKHLIS